MKKNIFALTLAGAVALAGCQKETSPVAPEEVNPIVITALADIESNVKTTLDGASVLWNTSDKIAVYNGSVVAEFTTDVTDGSAKADFTTTNPSFSEAGSYLAAYPYSDGLSFSDGKVSLTVPEKQTAKAGSFALGANVAVASGAAESLQFKNVCAYLKFTVPSSMTDLTKVEFAANGEESVAGEVSVNVADASYSVTSGVSSVVLEGTFEAGKSYYIAVLPGTLEGGFTITMTRGESTTVTMNTTKAFTFTRSHSANIGELYDGTWKVALEGTAVPEVTYMENCGNGYCSFRGNLSAGELKMRVLYENLELGSVNIPSDGWYHILLDTTTGTYQVYTQDVFVDLGNVGSKEPWVKVGSATAKDIALSDIQGEKTQMTLSVDSGFKLYTASLSDTQGYNYTYKDDAILLQVWYDGLTFSSSDPSENSDVKNITISGLDSGSEYDVRVICVRNNATNAYRRTKCIIGEQNVTINQGLKNEEYGGWAKVPFNQYVGEFSGIKPSDGKLEIGIQAISITGPSKKISDAHINAIQIFKKL